MTHLEPLNQSYDEEKLICAVGDALSDFYESLSKKMDEIKLNKIIKKKNPYLYRAKGISSASQVVGSILSAYVSSSEETIFGNCFFEPLALAVSGGQKAVTEGIDITVDKDNTIYSIAVKSGPSVYNADSRNKQEQNFLAAQKEFNRLIKVLFLSLDMATEEKISNPARKSFILN